jgi:hypothetical protein
MTLSLFLLALGTPPAAQPASSATQHSPVFAARGGTSATGFATVRILSSVSVGRGHPNTAPGAQHRSTSLTHPGGPAHPAQLIEFE